MQNYFSLLKIPQQWSVDTIQLRKNYFTAQQYWHPDNFTESAEKLNASKQAAFINDAYQAINDPLRRAQHLLRLAGVENHQHTTQDTALLEESMHWRERLLTENKVSVQCEAKAAFDQTMMQFDEHYQNKNYEAAANELLKAIYLAKI